MLAPRSVRRGVKIAGRRVLLLQKTRASDPCSLSSQLTTVPPDRSSGTTSHGAHGPGVMLAAIFFLYTSPALIATSRPASRSGRLVACAAAGGPLPELVVFDLDACLWDKVRHELDACL